MSARKRSLSLEEDNRLVLDGDPDAGLLDLNAQYRGYYPECRFTACGYVLGSYWAAGTDAAGLPHLFGSVMGSSWSETVIEQSPPAIPVENYGDILSVFSSPMGEDLLLVTSRGLLLTIPDCPHCVTAEQLPLDAVSAVSVTGDCLFLTGPDGQRAECSLGALCRHRVSLYWVTLHQAMVLDLRPAGSQPPVPHSVCLPPEAFRQLMHRLPPQAYVALLAETADEADRLAGEYLRRGLPHVRSLGSAEDALFTA